MNPVYLLIFFLSFTILALEVSLAILLSTLFFSSFFAVSFAFLGLSLAGVFTCLCYAKTTVTDLKTKVFDYLCLLGVSLLLFTVIIKDFHLVTSLFEFGFNQQWDARALGWNSYWNRLLIDMLRNSSVVGLVSTVIFFCLGVLYSLIYKLYAQEAPRLYFFDLLGAAVGCLFGVFSLNVLQLSSVLILLAVFAFVLIVGVSWNGPAGRKTAGLVCLLISTLVLGFNIKTGFFELEMSSLYRFKKPDADFKELRHQWNVYSRTSLFINNLPTDEDHKYAFSIINGAGYIDPFKDNNPYRLKLFARFKAVTLGFLLKPPKDILILMTGAGKDMVEAYSYSQGTADITGVELNPIIVAMGESLEGYHLKEFFAKPNVHMIVQEGRHYIESTDKKFDSIILSYSGASAVQYLGVAGATTQYLYTKEAFKSYFKHLKPGGTIGIVYGKKIKMAAMAKAALEELGYTHAAGKIMVLAFKHDVADGDARNEMLYTTNVLSVLVKNSDFTRAEVEDIERHLAYMGMMSVYTPFDTHKDFKIFEDLLDSPDLTEFLKRTGRQYHEDLSVPTDNVPFVDNGFIIKSFFERSLWEKILKGDWDDWTRQAVFNVSMLCFTVFLGLAGLVLIIFPLWFHAGPGKISGHAGFLAYFAVIGLGFMFTEIAIMRSFTLLWGPVYSFSIVLTGLLVATAVGGRCSDYVLKGYWSVGKMSLVAFLMLCAYTFAVPWVALHGLPMPLFFKLAVSGLVVLPLGFVLGIFFPQGLKALGRYEPDLVPWAWGFNGYMSIVGSALSISLSRLTGFSSLLFVAAVLYLIIACLPLFSAPHTRRYNPPRR